jgi:hypothetical protein
MKFKILIPLVLVLVLFISSVVAIRPITSIFDGKIEEKNFCVYSDNEKLLCIKIGPLSQLFSAIMLEPVNPEPLEQTSINLILDYCFIAPVDEARIELINGNVGIVEDIWNLPQLIGDPGCVSQGATLSFYAPPAEGLYILRLYVSSSIEGETQIVEKEFTVSSGSVTCPENHYDPPDHWDIHAYLSHGTQYIRTYYYYDSAPDCTEHTQIQVRTECDDGYVCQGYTSNTCSAWKECVLEQEPNTCDITEMVMKCENNVFYDDPWCDNGVVKFKVVEDCSLAGKDCHIISRGCVSSGGSSSDFDIVNFKVEINSVAKTKATTVPGYDMILEEVSQPRTKLSTSAVGYSGLEDNQIGVYLEIKNNKDVIGDVMWEILIYPKSIFNQEGASSTLLQSFTSGYYTETCGKERTGCAEDSDCETGFTVKGYFKDMPAESTKEYPASLIGTNYIALDMPGPDSIYYGDKSAYDPNGEYYVLVRAFNRCKDLNDPSSYVEYDSHYKKIMVKQIDPGAETEKKYILNPDNDEEWCVTIVGKTIAESCELNARPRKDPIPLSQLGYLDDLSVWDQAAVTYLDDVNNPICLVKLGDLQCKEGSECLAAKNSINPAYSDNKLVYDVLVEILTPTVSQEIWSVVDQLTLGTLEEIFGIDPIEAGVQQYGVCAYRERSIFDQAKRFLAEQLNMSETDPNLVWIMVGLAFAAIYLFNMLMNPPR